MALVFFTPFCNQLLSPLDQEDTCSRVVSGDLMLQQATMSLPPSAQGRRTSIQWTTGSSSITSKIRDSCQACASSKVKCHKEKPTCSRCSSRGIRCEYLPTKRPGRKRETTNARPMPEGQSLWPSATDLSKTPPRQDNVYETEGPSTPDLFSGLLVPFERNLSPAFVGMSSELDKFYNTPIDLAELGALDPLNFAQERNDIENLPIPDNLDVDLVSDSPSLNRPPASKVSSPSSNGQPLSARYTSVTGAIDFTCSCLMQALESMKKFSSTKPAACGPSNSPDHATTISSPSAQVVVIENKQTIEVISNILQCSCAEDTYLLTLISIIVFKMLDRYAIAARKNSGETTEGRDTPSRNASAPSRYYSSDTDLSERIAAQSILSELHHVQRLVNQLSPRLKTREMGAGGEGRRGSWGARDAEGGCKMASFSDSETTAATFLAATLDQIEIDLRSCLRTLSLEIISMLRQS